MIDDDDNSLIGITIIVATVAFVLFVNASDGVVINTIMLALKVDLAVIWK